MTRPPDLTDRPALARARARTRRAPALFLHHTVADEVQERLEEVNRSFTAPAVVTPFAQVWAPALPGARIVPDADILDLEPGAHDLVIHALALHWANDPVGQLVQCRRALRPDGLFLGILFGGRSLHELRAALAEAEVALTGGLSPRVLPMGEIRDLGALLQRAGFALPVADSVVQTVSYETPFHLMRDLRAMGEANALAARHRRAAPRNLFAEAARRYAQAHAGPDGRIPATAEMIYLTGWAPDDKQQKPLRPGSATTRLADALGTAEVTLPDRKSRGSD
ncbi:methyltransferase domain-containing protein [Rhodovulum adriaticum]|uniref:Methyltransferase family protein n=1 Tax=Rhodovulum adriaticum TaxID=35804 RepID=A0A4R2P1H2_RHOAD|nr:methyltransferase domain-containing protein [Rhodovulum adriaticum]MBK1636122.1 SAM-dependent methyltransferase [Rhodovulum adriaticum]TCP27505.1 methyltransferase family protein [Rhodovulum adriaticum]